MPNTANQLAPAAKPLIWLGDALAELKAFPQLARQIVAHKLNLLQYGLTPADSYHVPAVGCCSQTITLKLMQNYHVFYVKKHGKIMSGNVVELNYTPKGSEAIYVVHCCVNQTAALLPRDINVIQERLKALRRGD